MEEAKSSNEAAVRALQDSLTVKADNLQAQVRVHQLILSAPVCVVHTVL